MLFKIRERESRFFAYLRREAVFGRNPRGWAGGRDGGTGAAGEGSVYRDRHRF